MDLRPETIARVEAYDASKLLRSGKDYQFTDVKTEISEGLDWIRRLYEVPGYWETLPQNKRSTTNSILDNYLAIIDQINSFEPVNVPNPTDVRNNLVAQLRNQYEQLFDGLISPLRAYLGDTSTGKSEANRLTREARAALKDSEAIRDEILHIQRAAQTAAGTVADFEFAKIFSDRAKEHADAARKWLWASGGIVVLAALVYWVLLDILLSNKITFTASTVTKLILLTFVYYIVRISTQNYRAHRHLQVLSSHRPDVMKSVQAFEKSVEDGEYKDFMYAASAKVVFEAGETGYLTTKEGAGSADGDLMETLTKLLSARR